MTIFKQYGEERSGTNFLKRMIELNFADTVVFGSVLGWKHGLYQLTNGHDATAAKSHEDWVRCKRSDGKIHSVDGYALPYNERFLLEAAKKLNYLVSYKPLLPWLVSVRRFRCPEREYDESLVGPLFERFIDGYKTWLKLPNALIVDHGTLIDEKKCIRLLRHLQQRHKLKLRNPDFVVEKKIVRASTDLGIILSDTGFDGSYYKSHRYLSELPRWVVKLAGLPRFDTRFIEEVIWQP